MPYPPTCQSPVTCDGAPIGRKGDTWLCMACLGYTDKHKHFPEFSMSTVRKQIIAHVQQHGATHISDLARAINASVTSVSTVATTLRREGILMPAKGDGVIRLTPAPDDSALPDAVPDEDTVQTSEADVLRAEIDRLTERLSSAVEESMQRAKDLEITREKLRKCQHYSATADSVMEQMRRAAQNCAALEAGIRCAGPTVRLEWSPWQQDSGIWETYLRLKIGNIDVSIGQIVYQHGIYEAALHHSDRDGGVTTTITGTSLADVGTVYVAAMQSAGLTMPPIPTLPESA